MLRGEKHMVRFKRESARNISAEHVGGMWVIFHFYLLTEFAPKLMYRGTLLLSLTPQQLNFTGSVPKLIPKLGETVSRAYHP